MLGPLAPEDHGNITAALKQSDHVVSMSLTVPKWLLDNLSTISDGLTRFRNKCGEEGNTTCWERTVRCPPSICFSILCRRDVVVFALVLSLRLSPRPPSVSPCPSPPLRLVQTLQPPTSSPTLAQPFPVCSSHLPFAPPIYRPVHFGPFASPSSVSLTLPALILATHVRRVL
jgi:hypothetical protein